MCSGSGGGGGGGDLKPCLVSAGVLRGAFQRHTTMLRYAKGYARLRRAAS